MARLAAIATSSLGFLNISEESQIVSQNTTKRLIYFRGHKLELNSVLITQICKHYETITTVAKFEPECASRTLSNLYNLHAFRGNIINGKADILSCMTGPHHYFGFIDPLYYHIIEFNDNFLPIYKRINNYVRPNSKKTYNQITSKEVVLLNDVNWIKGNDISTLKLNKYKVNLDDENNTYLNTDNINISKKSINDEIEHKIFSHENLIENKKNKDNSNELSSDSLFKFPGILELNIPTVKLPLITNPHEYDLSSFKIQVVPNNEPFQFDQNNILNLTHAKHKLRIVTYNYGLNYVDEYLLNGNGIFIEKHEFIQIITPINEDCSGFVIFAREFNKYNNNDELSNVKSNRNNSLEFIAISLPFGYTLLVDSFAIHGDSYLTGMYSMAMTGNHYAMNTADTVFIKDSNTGLNVNFIVDKEQLINKNSKFNRKLLVSCNEMTLNEIHNEDKKIKNNINNSFDNENISKNPISIIVKNVKKIFFNPVVYTPNQIFGYEKTIGVKLPN